MRTKVEAGWKVYDNKKMGYVEELIVWADDQTHTFGFCHCAVINALLGNTAMLREITAQCDHATEVGGYRVMILPELKMIWLNVLDEQPEQEGLLHDSMQKIKKNTIKIIRERLQEEADKIANDY